MSRELNDAGLQAGPWWQPTTTQAQRVARAKLLADIRRFFAERGVLEVETPILSQHTVTDIHIDSFETLYSYGQYSETYYLQTSPEYPMKRLLAAGSGAIYQISKAFRKDESGAKHNPEFSLLEWYRPEWNHHQLMDEIDIFLQTLLETLPAERITYKQLFINYFAVDPFSGPLEELQHLAAQKGLAEADGIDDRDTLLQFLMGLITDLDNGENKPLFVFDFPASQAALARLSADDSQVAERFEVYIRGIELANGFHELLDSQEQRHRFKKDQDKRLKRGAPPISMDERLLAALEIGLPPCAGVALGVDRLLMIKLSLDRIDQVINFPWKIA